MNISLYHTIPPDMQDVVTLTTISLMNQISHAIEDIIIEHKLALDMFVGFQHFSRFLTQEQRYRQLAQVCRSLTVFGVADVEPPQIANIVFAPMPQDAALAKEWFVVAESAHFFTALIAQEQNVFDPSREKRRQFNAVWTYDAAVSAQATQLLSQTRNQAYPRVIERDYRSQYRYVTAISRYLVQRQEEASAAQTLQRHRTALLRAGLTTSDTALVIVDQAGQVVSLTPEAMQLLGEHIAHPMSPLSQVAGGALAAVQLDATVKSTTTLLHLADGGKVLVVARTVIDVDHQVLGWVLALQDTDTDGGEHTNRSNRVALIVNITQQQLQTVQELVAMLPQFDRRPDWQRLLVTHVQRVAGDLTMYMQRLGLLHTIERVGYAELVSLNLSTLVHEVVAGFELPALRRSVRLVVVAPTTVILQGDAGGLRMALSELITNALHHAPEGSEVTVSLEQRDDFVIVHVHDSSAGISPRDQAHIFEPFYRPSTKGDQSVGGGLGLAIVSAIARAHSGHMRIESGMGAGTTLKLLLPIQPEHTALLDLM
jgi:signal transduction histidine kinase